MTKISVVIPAYRPDTLYTPISSVINQTFDDWELLIVGQGKVEEKRASNVLALANGFSQKDSRIRYAHSNKMGHSCAVNTGIELAKGEIVSLLDDDCEAQDSWLETIAQYYAENPHIQLLGGRVLPPKKEKRLGVCPNVNPSEAVYDPVSSQYKPPSGFNWIGANVSFKREVALETGPFDEFIGSGTIFPAAGETDYMLRLERRGTIMMSTPKVSVIHKHGYRYGIKAVLSHTFNYAYGNGGLAGKLTLMGDPRGEKWKSDTIRKRVLGRLRSFHIHRLPFDIIRLNNFLVAYHRCIKEYQVIGDLLAPIDKKQSRSFAGIR
ncbi:MAG: glycosyltransferase family 2 protein [Ardenticatenaceae bacterium]|nr:glycosyltransferase family 2 protein [Ardenticatenaceae bacterium]